MSIDERSDFLSVDLTKIRPISHDSRLLRDINTGIKIRVNQDIQQRALLQSAQLRKKTLDNIKHNSHELKHHFKNKRNDRVSFNENEIMKWRLKTANSPYRLDQVEVDMQIRDRTLEILRDRKERKQRKNLVKKMNGEADLCFMNEKFISKLDQEEKLAIKHFAMLKQLDTVQKEKKKLEKLVLTECDKIETRFVKIALLRAQKRSKEHHINSSNNNDTESDSVSSIWGTLRQPKIKPNDAKILKSIDNRVYNAEGYYNASGEFIPAVRDRDKVGLMPATYAQIAVGRISPVLKKRLSKIEKF